jgi:AraC family transcriptional regulator
VYVNPGGLSHFWAHTVVLWGRRAHGAAYHVRDFEGPLSIKAVVQGTGLWETPEGRFSVDRGSYLVLNEGQRYSLTIESADPVETFCVFFPRGLLGEALRSLVGPPGHLLDDADVPASPLFIETLRPHDHILTPGLRRLYDGLASGRPSELWLEEQVHSLAAAILVATRDLNREMARVPAVRASTRAELLKRLHRGRDFIDSSLGERLTLSTIARESCLSAFHFHRLFSQLFRETPRAYIVRRRLERAGNLLITTGRSITEISLECGFESPGSFSTLFRKRLGTSPSEYRRSKPRVETGWGLRP